MSPRTLTFAVVMLTAALTAGCGGGAARHTPGTLTTTPSSYASQYRGSQKVQYLNDCSQQISNQLGSLLQGQSRVEGISLFEGYCGCSLAALEAAMPLQRALALASGASDDPQSSARITALSAPCLAWARTQLVNVIDGSPISTPPPEQSSGN